MATMQEVIDEARLDLNDDDKVRYPDTDLLIFGNDAIALAYGKRPDFRVGSDWSDPVDLALGGTFPLPIKYRSAVAHYIVARAEARDEEHVTSGAAAQAIQAAQATFLGQL